MSEIIRIFVKYLQVFLVLNMYGYKCKYSVWRILFHKVIDIE